MTGFETRQVTPRVCQSLLPSLFEPTWASLGWVEAVCKHCLSLLIEYASLARWQNAPTTGLDLVTENIIKNHHVRPIITRHSVRS